jgi:hypothetical protein
MDLNAMAACIQNAIPASSAMVDNFNETLMEFLVNLRATFPDFQLVLTNAINELQAAIQLGQKHLSIMMFIGVLGETGLSKIHERDETYLFNLFGSMSLIKSFNLEDVWSQCPPNVRENIWLNLNELACLANAHSGISNESRADIVRSMQVMDKKIEEMLKSGMQANDVLSALLAKK